MGSLYAPYIQADVAHHFGSESQDFNLTQIDLFLPIFQNHSQILFADLRSYIPTVSGYNGNFQMGYRWLAEDTKQMYGVYSSFDIEKPTEVQYLRQATFGIEARIKDWFLGVNYYQPLRGKSFLNSTSDTSDEYIKAMSGSDLELGRQFTENFTIYLGGCYFNADKLKPIYGPKLSLNYEGSLNRNNKLSTIIDHAGIYLDCKYDKPRGAYLVLGAKLRISPFGKQRSLNGFAKHMIATIRRENSIIYGRHYIQKNKENSLPKDNLLLQQLPPPPPPPKDPKINIEQDSQPASLESDSGSILDSDSKASESNINLVSNSEDNSSPTLTSNFMSVNDTEPLTNATIAPSPSPTPNLKKKMEAAERASNTTIGNAHSFPIQKIRPLE